MSIENYSTFMQKLLIVQAKGIVTPNKENSCSVSNKQTTTLKISGKCFS